MIYDLVIIGASAAGMSAGIYAARAGINFVIISKDKGGNVANAGIVENYLGTISKLGLELSKKFEAHLAEYDPKIISGEAKRLTKENDIFIVDIGKEKIESKAVIVSTGTNHRKLNIPSEKMFENKGVSYCETCDGSIFKNKIVAVIGGGNSAIKAALSLANIASKVFVINIEDKFKAEKIYLNKIEKNSNVELIYKAKTEKFEGNDFLEKLIYEDMNDGERKTLKTDGAFIYVGLIPNTRFIDENFEALNNKKEIVIDKFGYTRINGLFAAGDVTDFPYRQISIAAGAGATALLSVIEYLERN